MRPILMAAALVVPLVGCGPAYVVDRGPGSRYAAGPAYAYPPGGSPAAVAARREAVRDYRQDVREWRQDRREDQREARQERREDVRERRQDRRDDRRGW